MEDKGKKQPRYDPSDTDSNKKYKLQRKSRGFYLVTADSSYPSTHNDPDDHRDYVRLYRHVLFYPNKRHATFLLSPYLLTPYSFLFSSASRILVTENTERKK